VHLARRAYLLVLLTAVLAIAGIWSSDAAMLGWWRLPALLLLVGLAWEGVFLRRRPISARLDTASRALLGREQPAAFVFSNDSARSIAIEYAPATPAGFEPLPELRRVRVPARGSARDVLSLLPVRLGAQTWPPIPARVCGPLSFAWWSLVLQPGLQLTVAPDARGAQRRLQGLRSGARPRALPGAGTELHQLRAYVRGDPLGSIDWKATARAGALVTREFSEDQHLDVLIAIDAGRLSRIRAGALDRLGLYANLAARLAELIVQLDDRVGLVIYADRVLARCAPARGLPALIALRRTLEQLSVQPAESDPTAAAISVRRMLRHRGLVLLLTDLDDAILASQLVRAVRLLAPPHLVVVAGVHSGEVAALSQRVAQQWPDPWIALAASEHEARAEGQRLLLRRLGAPVVSAPAQQLEQAVVGTYETLRRTRRV
jgi:uncharacterized protein (DUF58 family)